MDRDPQQEFDRSERRRARFDRMARRQRRRWVRQNRGFEGMAFGILILAAGVLFLLRNLDIVYFDSIWQFWPLCLLVPGLSRLISSDDPLNEVGGLVLTGVGTLFLLLNLNILPREVWNWFWPVVLIVVGGLMLVRHLDRRGNRNDWSDHDWTEPSPGAPPSSGQSSFMGRRSGRGPGVSNLAPDPAPSAEDRPKRDHPKMDRPKNEGARAGRASDHEPASEQTDDGWFAQDGDFQTSSATSRLKIEVIFGATRRRLISQNFEGGKATAVFGGIELDLRDVRTKRDEIVVQADAVFGGVDITVPTTWDVDVRGTGVFGGYEDKTYPPAPRADGGKPILLIVKGGAVFGGVTVRN